MFRASSPPRAPARRERGTTFAELMLAAAIVGTTVVGAAASFTQTTRVYDYFTEGAHEALMLAQEIKEVALTLPWEDGGPALFGDDVVSVWDLDGQSYSPPRAANYDIVTSHIGWSQEAVVRVVDLMNPEVEVDPETFEGETLTELEVTIYQGINEMGVFSWWLSEPEETP